MMTKLRNPSLIGIIFLSVLEGAVALSLSTVMPQQISGISEARADGVDRLLRRMKKREKKANEEAAALTETNRLLAIEYRENGKLINIDRRRELVMQLLQAKLKTIKEQYELEVKDAKKGIYHGNVKDKLDLDIDSEICFSEFYSAGGTLVPRLYFNSDPSNPEQYFVSGSNGGRGDGSSGSGGGNGSGFYGSGDGDASIINGNTPNPSAKDSEKYMGDGRMPEDGGVNTMNTPNNDPNIDPNNFRPNNFMGGGNPNSAPADCSKAEGERDLARTERDAALAKLKKFEELKLTPEEIAALQKKVEKAEKTEGELAQCRIDNGLKDKRIKELEDELEKFKKELAKSIGKNPEMASLIQKKLNGQPLTEDESKKLASYKITMSKDYLRVMAAVKAKEHGVNTDVFLSGITCEGSSPDMFATVVSSNDNNKTGLLSEKVDVWKKNPRFNPRKKESTKNPKNIHSLKEKEYSLVMSFKCEGGVLVMNLLRVNAEEVEQINMDHLEKNAKTTLDKVVGVKVIGTPDVDPRDEMVNTDQHKKKYPDLYKDGKFIGKPAEKKAEKVE